jgi:hypothetical protein
MKEKRGHERPITRVNILHGNLIGRARRARRRKDRIWATTNLKSSIVSQNGVVYTVRCRSLPALSPTSAAQGDFMTEYREIEDVKEIARLNNELSATLGKKLSYYETRTIGYPQGDFSAEVHFLSRRGEHVFWWAPLPSDQKKVHNYFGHGAPGDTASLNIDVQFNLPVVTFSRSLGGAFLRHTLTNAIVLAHRPSHRAAVP